VVALLMVLNRVISKRFKTSTVGLKAMEAEEA
jgi:hypothetical protein